MEELTKRNIKRIWLREIEKTLKRFGAFLEWLLERITMREEEMGNANNVEELNEQEKSLILLSKKNEEQCGCP